MELNLVNQNGQDANLEVLITETDYQAKVKEEMKKIRKTAVIPGFRKGQIPQSLINKQFGVKIKLEAIQDALNAEMEKYMSEHRENILVSPITQSSEIESILEENPKALLKTKDFKLIFSVGLSPELNLKELVEKKGLKGYEVSVSDADVEEKITEIRKDFAEEETLEDLTTFPESFEHITITADIKELDGDENVLEDGFSKENAEFKIDEDSGITSEVLKKIFHGDYQASFKTKLVDVLGKETFSKYFNTDEQVVADLDNFLIEVKSITKTEPAKLEETFFNQVNEYLSKSEAIADKKVEDEAGLKRVVKHELENDALRLKAVYLERSIFDTMEGDEDITLPEEATDKLIEERLKDAYEEIQKNKEEEEDKDSEEQSFEDYKEKELPKMKDDVRKGLKMQGLFQAMQRKYEVIKVQEQDIIDEIMRPFSRSLFIDYLPKGDERIFQLLTPQLGQRQVQETAAQIYHTAYFKQFAKDLSFKETLSLKEAQEKLEKLKESKETADDNQ